MQFFYYLCSRKGFEHDYHDISMKLRLVLLAVMAALAMNGFAEYEYSVKKQVEKNDFTGAMTKVQKTLAKEPQSFEALYSLSRLYIVPKEAGNPFFAPEEAYTTLEKAHAAFAALDAKKQAKAISKGWTEETRNADWQRITDAGFTLAMQQNSMDGWKHFLDFYRHADADRTEYAWSEIHRMAFAEAQRLNTVESYTAFIDTYPQAQQVQTAQDAIFALRWAQAQAANTEQAYRGFAVMYPSKPEAAEALQRADRVHYETATAGKTLAEYENYITNFAARTEYADMAREAIYEQVKLSEDTLLLQRSLSFVAEKRKAELEARIVSLRPAPEASETAQETAPATEAAPQPAAPVITPYAYLDDFTPPTELQEKVRIYEYFPKQFYNTLMMDNQTTYYRVKANGKYGIMDEYNNVCLPVIFDEVIPVSGTKLEGNMPFKFRDGDRWGFCYYDGSIVLFPFYREITADRDYYYVTDTDGQKHQLARNDSDTRYEEFWSWAKKEGLKHNIFKSFLLDFSECKKIYLDEFDFPESHPISDGYICVRDKNTGAYQFFDSKGNIAIPFAKLPKNLGGMNSNWGYYFDLPQFHAGYCVFRVEYTNAHTTYTIIDTQGNKTPLPSSTCYCSDFVEGGYALKFVQDKINLRPVYINGKGQEIMSGIYAGKKVYMGSVSGDVNYYARPRCCGMTAFYDFDKQLWGFANASGKIVIPAKFEKVHDFSEDLAAVKMPQGGENAGKWGFIDKTGKFVIPARYANEPMDFSEGIAALQKTNENWVYIDRTGTVISREFDYVNPFLWGTAYVGDFNRRLCLINRKMEIVRGDLSLRQLGYWPMIDGETGYYLVQEEDYIMQECVKQWTDELVYVRLRPSKWEYEPIRHLFCDPTGKVLFELCLNEF